MLLFLEKVMQCFERLNVTYFALLYGMKTLLFEIIRISS